MMWQEGKARGAVSIPHWDFTARHSSRMNRDGSAEVLWGEGQVSQNPLIPQEAAWPEAEILQEVRGRVNPASGMPSTDAMDRAASSQEFTLR